MEENNKIIAEFMNFPKITNVRDSESGKYYDYWLPNNFNLILEQEIQIESNNGWGLVHQDCVFVRDLIFHSDWNWLMEVVEKITTILMLDDNYKYNYLYIGYDFEDKEHYVNLYVSEDTQLNGSSKNSKIEATYKAVLNFINFYNKQKEE